MSEERGSKDTGIQRHKLGTEPRWGFDGPTTRPALRPAEDGDAVLYADHVSVLARERERINELEARVEELSNALEMTGSEADEVIGALKAGLLAVEKERDEQHTEVLRLREVIFEAHDAGWKASALHHRHEIAALNASWESKIRAEIARLENAESQPVTGSALDGFRSLLVDHTDTEEECPDCERPLDQGTTYCSSCNVDFGDEGAVGPERETQTSDEGAGTSNGPGSMAPSLSGGHDVCTLSSVEVETGLCPCCHRRGGTFAGKDEGAVGPDRDGVDGEPDALPPTRADRDRAKAKAREQVNASVFTATETSVGCPVPDRKEAEPTRWHSRGRWWVKDKADSTTVAGDVYLDGGVVWEATGTRHRDREVDILKPARVFEGGPTGQLVETGEVRQAERGEWVLSNKNGGPQEWTGATTTGGSYPILEPVEETKDAHEIQTEPEAKSPSPCGDPKCQVPPEFHVPVGVDRGAGLEERVARAIWEAGDANEAPEYTWEEIQRDWTFDYAGYLKEAQAAIAACFPEGQVLVARADVQRALSWAVYTKNHASVVPWGVGEQAAMERLRASLEGQGQSDE